MDRKMKGDLGQAKALSYLVHQNYAVFMPFADNGPIDLLAMKDSIVYKISIKSTSSKSKYGAWLVTLKTVSRRKDNAVKVNKFDATTIDKLLVYLIPEDRIIEIDSKNIKSKTQLSIMESKLGGA